MNINDKINREDLFVITGTEMARLVQLSKQLTAGTLKIENTIHDWPLIMTELVDSAQLASDRSVLQQWVQGLTYMQQSTLLTAIRGPDGQSKYAPPKMLLRWFRRCILMSALDGVVLDNPYDARGGSFTGPSLEKITPRWRMPMEEHVTDYVKNMDAVPAHFQRHFMHAIEILGYKHPDQDIQMFWYETYLRLCREMHVGPEDEDALDRRLGDNREAWLANADKATHA